MMLVSLSVAVYEAVCSHLSMLHVKLIHGLTL